MARPTPPSQPVAAVQAQRPLRVRCWSRRLVVGSPARASRMSRTLHPPAAPQGFAAVGQQFRSMSCLLKAGRGIAIIKERVKKESHG